MLGKGTSIKNNLSVGFQRSVKAFSERPALDVNNETYTYLQLSAMANVLCKVIRNVKMKDEKLVALFSYRSIEAYAGVLGILGAGCGYVPLHPDFPVNRTSKVVDLAQTNIMIVSNECRETFDELLRDIKKKMIFILVGVEGDNQYVENYSEHEFIVVDDLLSNMTELLSIDSVKKEDIAYLLFTSGSTGEPKGVPVMHLNGRSFIEFQSQRYEINEHDRFSQLHDMTFDNSIQDIFVAWENGACVCVATKEDKFLPVSFIQKKKITVWFSVPSVASIIDRYGRLKEGVFPLLRYSFFAGEALPINIAKKWQEASCNGKIINTYGPTETTVTISYYDWDSDISLEKCVNGIVPLGEVYEGNKVKLIREDGLEAGVDEPGELCFSGLQVTREYWNNLEQTQKHYVTFSDSGDEIWYRTGDLARLGEDGLLYYLGRIDNQVQIQGNRVELGAIDKVLCEVSGTELAVSVPLLISPGNAGSMVAFICGFEQQDENYILEHCRNKLPKYMVPTKVHFIDDMPLNVNGKIDRIQLQEML